MRLVFTTVCFVARTMSSASHFSCERINTAEFHNVDAQMYSAKCVDELTHSKSFHAYVRHVRYRERLFLLWCIVPIGVLGAIYYHYSLCINHICPPVALLPAPPLALSGVYRRDNLSDWLQDGRSYESVEIKTSLEASLPYVTLFLVFYLLPSVVVAPFVGFFNTPSKLDCLHAYMLLTGVNVMLVSIAGTRVHYPPYIISDPPICPVTDKLLSTLLVIVQRALPLQGLLHASFTVCMWQHVHWRHVWHFIFPLATIPLLVGGAGAICWRITMLSMPHFVHNNGSVTNLTTSMALIQNLDDVSSVWSAVKNVAMNVGAMLLDDIHSVSTYVESFGVSARGLDASTLQNIYRASLSLTLVYFTVLLLFPFVRFTVRVAMLMLPTHPTTWLLNLLGACAALWAMLYSPMFSHIHIGYLAGVIMFVMALLYNGFIA